MKSESNIAITEKNNKVRGFLLFIKRNPKFIAPITYVLILVLGLFLMEIAKIIPGFKLQGCVNLGGQDVCTLFGVYIATVVSLPGYILLGGLLRFLGLNFPQFESYIMLLLVNIIVYYLAGSLSIKLISIRKNPDKLVTYVIISLLTILIITFLLLKTV